ncbi:MAG: hypothetical protein IKX67_09275 [Bacteroidales bacterium]|nr:hypothetical protein [Bacteroidales bacterium]
MKKLSSFVLLSIGILLLLTGCVQKIDNLAGKAVSLKVVGNYGAPASRTAYSSEGTWVDANDHSKGLSWERINWSATDSLLIWGTNVTVREGLAHPVYGTTHIATYNLSNIQKKNDNQSIADLDDRTGYGLRYDDDANSYTFWGIYPADAALGESAPSGNEVSFEIAGEQTADASGNPDMHQAVMLSVLPNASPTGNNEMEFYPAFTAYQFDITTKTSENFTLKRIKITSANGTTKLWGKVAATIAAGGASTYAVSDGGTSITCTPSTALAISDTQHAVLTLFANPNGSEGLKVSFVLAQEGNPAEIVRTATLKKSGADMSFAGLKKHIIKGIIVPTDVYFDKITLQLQVQGWDEYTLAEAAASDNVQTTQFVVSGNETARLKNGRDDLGQGSGKRQYWYFTSGGVVTVSFKVMLPENGTWSVVPSDTENFSVTNVSSGTSSTTLSGTIGDDGATVVTLEIRYIGEDSDPHELYLNTYATKNSNTFSLDSETQLFDIRGYHYFVVNDATYLASFN